MGHSTNHSCRECGGPTVAVTVVKATRFAPQRVRVAHRSDCRFFFAFKQQFPELIKQREDAETDRILGELERRR